jgi:hypothetical protein
LPAYGRFKKRLHLKILEFILKTLRKTGGGASVLLMILIPAEKILSDFC